jgi:two-component system phosphate regulon response regulator PhoB
MKQSTKPIERTTHQHILVVDDEPDILELIRHNLLRCGFVVSTAASGEEALQRIARQAPHLVVLDLMLPGIDGLEVARRLKTQPRTVNIPIVMLTAKGEEKDVVAGLETGADDYVTKPFSPQILVARIRTVLRRNEAPEEKIENPIIRFRDLKIDLRKHRAYLESKTVPLTYTEFHVLAFLARRPGWAFTRAQIVDAVRGDTYSVTDRSVDVQIVGLRKKLGPYAEFIETVRGVGYRFKDADKSTL